MSEQDIELDGQSGRNDEEQNDEYGPIGDEANDLQGFSESRAKDRNASSEGGQNEKRAVTATRRGAMALAGLAGLGFVSSQSASTASGGPPHYNWREDVDAGNHALEGLGEVQMSDNPEPVRDFAGRNLTIDDGLLHADGDRGLPDTDADLTFHVGGVWVGSDDPLEEFPDHVEENDRWYDTGEFER